MPLLAINGITVSSIMAIEDPTGERRDIGDESMGADGTLRITRQTRKRDLKFKTIPLSISDAHAWESLFIGEGEVWTFDSSLYGSKGLGPSSSTLATIVAGSTKFGAGKLELGATTGSISFNFPAVNMYNSSQILWTVSVWRSTDSGVTWTSYVVRGTDAAQDAKWVDGVRNDAASTTWLSVAADGKVTISNTTAGAVQYDDLVVLPYWVLVTWPPQFYSSAFSSLPYVTASGSMITEQAFRTVIGSVAETIVKTAGASGFKSHLSVELRAK